MDVDVDGGVQCVLGYDDVVDILLNEVKDVVLCIIDGIQYVLLGFFYFMVQFWQLFIEYGSLVIEVCYDGCFDVEDGVIYDLVQVQYVVIEFGFDGGLLVLIGQSEVFCEVVVFLLEVGYLFIECFIEYVQFFFGFIFIVDDGVYGCFEIVGGIFF